MHGWRRYELVDAGADEQRCDIRPMSRLFGRGCNANALLQRIVRLLFLEELLYSSWL